MNEGKEFQRRRSVLFTGNEVRRGRLNQVVSYRVWDKTRETEFVKEEEVMKVFG